MDLPFLLHVVLDRYDKLLLKNKVILILIQTQGMNRFPSVMQSYLALLTTVHYAIVTKIHPLPGHPNYLAHCGSYQNRHHRDNHALLPIEQSCDEYLPR